MRRAILLLSAVLVAATPLWAENNIPEGAQWMPGEVLFKLKQTAYESSTYKPTLAATGRTGIATIDAALERLAVSNVALVFRQDVNAAAKSAAGMDRIFIARFTSTESPPEAATRLAAITEIEWAEPNGIGHGDMTPNDPLYNQQWGVRNVSQAVAADGDTVGTLDCDIDANQCWDVQTVRSRSCSRCSTRVSTLAIPSSAVERRAVGIT
jgi:hypothetical protein